MSTHKPGAARLLAAGAMASALVFGAMAGPASAKSAGYESILGGHIKSGSEAQKIASKAKAKGFKVYVQRISGSNWEAEIFNGGTKSQALRVCQKARNTGGLAHCSIEQEFHGNHWG